MAPAAGTLLARRDVAGWVFSSLVYEPRTVLGWHAHPNSYLSFVETGSYTERLGGLTRHCETSTLLLHPAGERHANVFHDRAVNLLRVEASDADLLDVPLGAASSDGCRGEPSRSLCRRMLRELRAPDDLTPLALQGLALELVAGVARASTRRHREPAWLERVDELLDERAHEPLGLAAIAAHAGVHPVHLARTHRRYRHQSIGERVRELRMERACRLLAATQDSIAEVAQSCGFADQSHLARLMRRRLGVSPSGYRAQRAGR